MKEYFSHDYSARTDQKLVKIQMKMGMEGIGIYWCLIEMLYENDGKILLDEIETIAFELRTECERITSVLKEFELFKFKSDYFYSDSVNKRLVMRKEKSDKARASAVKRWGSDRKNDADAMRSHSDGNAIKVKKSKVKKIDNRFSEFWDSFHSITSRPKTDRTAAEKKWKSLTNEERTKAIEMIQPYFESLDDKKYCKKARTYLSDKNFDDEFKITQQQAL